MKKLLNASKNKCNEEYQIALTTLLIIGATFISITKNMYTRAGDVVQEWINSCCTPFLAHLAHFFMRSKGDQIKNIGASM